jgi:hypothetical protein
VTAAGRSAGWGTCDTGSFRFVHAHVPGGPGQQTMPSFGSWSPQVAPRSTRTGRRGTGGVAYGHGAGRLWRSGCPSPVESESCCSCRSRSPKRPGTGYTPTLRPDDQATEVARLLGLWREPGRRRPEATRLPGSCSLTSRARVSVWCREREHAASSQDDYDRLTLSSPDGCHSVRCFFVLTMDMHRPHARSRSDAEG